MVRCEGCSWLVSVVAFGGAGWVDVKVVLGGGLGVRGGGLGACGECVSGSTPLAPSSSLPLPSSSATSSSPAIVDPANLLVIPSTSSVVPSPPLVVVDLEFTLHRHPLPSTCFVTTEDVHEGPPPLAIGRVLDAPPRTCMKHHLLGHA